MRARRIYGTIAGVLTGAAPFWILGVRAGQRWPGWVALAAAVVLSGTAAATPAAWALGVSAGAALSWLAMAALVGADWRLLPYVFVASGSYYVCAALAITAGYGLRVAAKTPRNG